MKTTIAVVLTAVVAVNAKRNLLFGGPTATEATEGGGRDVGTSTISIVPGANNCGEAGKPCDATLICKWDHATSKDMCMSPDCMDGGDYQCGQPLVCIFADNGYVCMDEITPAPTTEAPTFPPTEPPTEAPTPPPTVEITPSPTTESPTFPPTESPTEAPTVAPTMEFYEFEASIGTYPGYTGGLSPKGSVTVKPLIGTTMIEFSFYLEDMEEYTKGGIHIHTGVTCGSDDAVGGHYWTASDVLTEDPWTTKYDADMYGEANDKFKLDTGHAFSENENHAVVVHDNDGVRIGCGVLLVPTS